MMIDQRDKCTKLGHILIFYTNNQLSEQHWSTVSLMEINPSGGLLSTGADDVCPDQSYSLSTVECIISIIAVFYSMFKSKQAYL